MSLISTVLPEVISFTEVLLHSLMSADPYMEEYIQEEYIHACAGTILEGDVRGFSQMKFKHMYCSTKS